MSVFHENMLIGASGQGAAGPTAGRSVRFNSADSAYLSRTPASTGNRRTFTYSAWVKPSALAAGGRTLILLSVNDGTDYSMITTSVNADDDFAFTARASGVIHTKVCSSARFRDFSAWYHFVCAVDSTQATSSNRVKLYVNGSQITDLSSTLTYPAQNTDYMINTTTQHTIGRDPSFYTSAYLAEVNFIDGQALTPSSFGETSATTGQWIAKTYSGTYGTNGFFLDFLDNSTTAALGYDAAGSNDWTVNNLSVTAGSGNDSLRDHPTSAGTDSGVGGEVSGNYCTLNPLDKNANLTLSNGNLELQASASAIEGVKGTIAIPTSGKYYAEANITSWTASGYFEFGIAPRSASNSDWFGVTSGTGFTIEANGTTDTRLRLNGSNVTVTGAVTTGDVFKVAVDYANQKVWVGKNSVWYDSSGGTTGNPATGANATGTLSSTETYLPAALKYGTSNTVACNFGQRAFAYTAPSGFSPLVDTLLPTPTIAKPASYFDTVLYTGTGSSLTPTSTLGFSPDMVWIKSRSAATDHAWYDTVRGVEKRLEPNTADAEVSSDGGITAFNSAGFTVGTLAQVNTNTATYVAWAWDAASSDSTNTDGTTTSTIRVNTSAGFSIAAYSGANAVRTVGHGLGVAPAFMLVQPRNVGDYAYMYHSAVGNTQFIYLGSADAPTTSTIWNNTTPTSSVFSLGSTTAINSAGVNAVAYCWAPVAGYSSFGSYTGNGSSTNGPFIYLGFRAAVIIVRRSSSTGNWTILDDKREGYNVDNDPLYPNRTDIEATTDLIDITSNGFKVRTTDATFNASGSTYIYAAWASAPFPYSRAR